MNVPNKTILVVAVSVAGISAIGCSPRQWFEADNDEASATAPADVQATADVQAPANVQLASDLTQTDATMNDRETMTSGRSPIPADSEPSAIVDRDLEDVPQREALDRIFSDEPSPSIPATQKPDLLSGDDGIDQTLMTRLNAVGNTASDYIDLVADADGATREIVRWTGEEDSSITPQQNRERLLAVLRIKRDAAAALASADDANAAQQIAGRRGRLQALSGLASLGDSDSSGLLRYAAAKASHSPDTSLSIDAHCVLVALGVQSLVAGDPSATEDILGHVRSIDQRMGQSSPASSDADVRDALSTLNSLGTARDMLAKYGEDDAAAVVRKVILKHYGGSEVPVLANMAATASGDVPYRDIDRSIGRLIANDSATADQVPLPDWRESIQRLIDQTPTVQTVAFLATSALQLESFGRGDYADAIYSVMTNRFVDADSPATQQVDIAIAAANQRRSMIGKQFRPAGTSLRDQPMAMSDFAGRIVLMPFWSSTSPESTAMIPALVRLRESYPDDLAVVGMNLDLVPGNLGDAVETQLPDIVSFAGAAPSRTTNPLAQQFGMVSLPFVVIIDRQSAVAAFAYGIDAINEQLKRLGVVDPMSPIPSGPASPGDSANPDRPARGNETL